MTTLKKTTIEMKYRKENINENTTLIKLIYIPLERNKGKVELQAFKVNKVNSTSSKIISSDMMTKWNGLNASNLGNFNQFSKRKFKKAGGDKIPMPSYSMYTTWEQLSIDQVRFFRYIKSRKLRITEFITDIKIG